MRPEAPVCIVGAGPVGLTTAARLASHGVRSVVLDCDPELRKQGSKACLIQGDALEVLDKFGCAEQIRDEGVTWHTARTYVRNQEIRATVFPASIGFGPFVNISQYRIEQALLERVLADALCEVRWSHRVTGLEQEADGVVVSAETPAGAIALRCRYVVACDGVRSGVRDAIGAEWTGYTHKDRFLITDIRARLPLAQERHFHYDPSFNPGRQVVMHPQPDDIWRIDWQLAPNTDIDEERRTGAFDARVRAVIGDVPYEVDWLSTYRFHQRVVDRFAVGRVFLAGDAAHALPPYGSRGMNSGIQDADNIAWKLALVLQGAAGERLLQTYHAERHAAAVENLAVTEATIRFMVPPTALRRHGRSVLLWLCRPLKSVRGRVNSGHMAEPFHYLDSPIVDAPDGHPMIGRFAPDGWVAAADGRRERVRRLLGTGFVALVFADDAEQVGGLVEHWQARAAAVPTATLVLVLPAGTHLPELAAGFAAVCDVDGTLREAYGVRRWTCLLVRPDGHVAAALEEPRGADVRAALSRCAGVAERPAVIDTPSADRPPAFAPAP